jgi:hypothetical protein
MSKQPLDYQDATRGEDPIPHKSIQWIISCSLLGLAFLCGLVAMVWSQRRSELLAAAAGLGAAAVIVHMPYWRM